MRAKGRTYENVVGRRLKARIINGDFNAELVEHQWIWFEDENGKGFAQLDYYLICAGFIVIVECKLSQSDDAIPQMTLLYKPLLEKIYGCPVICVQVCKNLRYHPKDSIRDIEDIVKEPRAGVFTWHYLG